MVILALVSAIRSTGLSTCGRSGFSLFLSMVPQKQRTRYSSQDSRGRLTNKRHITERPADAEHQKEPGHWEIDTVVGRGT